LKFLIVGLGNVGAEYAHTRHNIGFDIADALAKSAGAFFSLDRHAFKCEYRFKGKTVVVIKPTTYMNLSGKAVNYWLQAEKISIENLFVVTDDIALSFGTIRVRTKGSDGGHNGLVSIIESLDTINFPRLRFGIGNEFPKGAQVDYVLSTWTNEEEKVLPGRMEKATDVIKSFISIGVAQTMNLFNNK
jgi:PTH1 family peptidyl-tRNA hydrolase